MATASNDFAGTGALGASYTVLTGGLSRDSDELIGSNSSYNIAWVNDVTFDEDHWSEIIVDSYGLDGYGVVAVRASGSGGTGTCYFWTFTATSGGNADLFRRVNGTDTKVVNLAENFGVPAVGDRARLRAEGQGSSTVIRAYINDVEIFSYTDTSGSHINTGAPAFGTFRTSSRVASWEAGDDAVAGGALSGTASSTSSASGTLQGAGALAGNASSTATASATFTLNNALSGSASATSSASGTLGGAGALSGYADGQTDEGLEGYLLALAAFSGSSSATATGAGTIGGRGALSGSASATSTGSGTLTNLTPGDDALSGSSSASASASGTLSGAGGLSGSASASSSASATFGAILALTGSASASATGSGGLSGAGVLAGQAQAIASATALLVASGALSGSGSGASSGSGNLADGNVSALLIATVLFASRAPHTIKVNLQ